MFKSQWVIVFNKAERSMQCKFKFQNNHIEYTPLYKYLGTFFALGSLLLNPNSITQP